MIKTCMLLVVALVLAPLLPMPATGQPTAGPETVVVHDGSITLHALLWRPQGRGPFPAILCNHGSGRTREELVGSDHTNDRLKHWGRCSRAMAMYSCFSSGGALDCPPARVRVPST